MGNKERSNLVRFTQIVFQMAAVIGGFAWLGYYLDHRNGEDGKLFTIILTLLGVGLAMFQVIREVSNIGKDKE